MRLTSRWQLACALVVTTAACKPLDPYADSWAKVAITDSRASVHSQMGDPSSINQIELPLITFEQDAWRTITGKVYLGTFVMGHLVAKNIIE